MTTLKKPSKSLSRIILFLLVLHTLDMWIPMYCTVRLADEISPPSAYFILGKIQESRDRLREASTAFEKSLNLLQRHSGIHYQIGYVQHKLGQLSYNRGDLEGAS